MCWRGIEAQMTRKGAQRINAGQNRADLAIDNRDGRYVGGRVDDVTHGSLPWRFARRQKELETKTAYGDCRSASLAVASLLRRLIGRRSSPQSLDFESYRTEGGNAIARMLIGVQRHDPDDSI
jgi:hypothetical protein